MRLFDRTLTAPKRFIQGTHRTRDPVETLREFSRLMPALGITRLANVTGLDNIGHPVYMAVRPNARSISVAQGKGQDIATAKASALMEAIESWHAEHVSLPLRRSSHRELLAESATLDPATLPRPPGSEGWSPGLPMLWVQGWDLMTERPTWLPFDCVSVDYVWPVGRAPMFLQSSNGLASGNHPLEAILHALCELVERDATALWKADDDESATKAQQLDLSTIDDPLCAPLLRRLAVADVCAGIWDITSDIDVATYACGIFDRPRWQGKGLTMGYGTHLSPAVALSRALSEAIQSRMTAVAGSRDDLTTEAYEVLWDESALHELVAQVEEPAPRLDFHHRVDRSTPTFEGDLEVVLDELRRASIEQVVVADLTRSELGVPVVKVIAPGLEIDAPSCHGRRWHERRRELER